MIEGILIGLFSGWLSLIVTVIVLGKRMVKNPPKAFLELIGKAMARSMSRQITKKPNVTNR